MDKLKILIAEDDKVCQEFYKEGLPDDSYEKRFVSNGRETVEIYQAWNPDIIVLDLMMPIKSGYTALKEIRQMDKKLNKTTVIIVVSNLSDESDITDCVKLGIQGYIVKPFKANQIKHKILRYYKKFHSSKDGQKQ